jgi:hypothetical protein
VCGVGEIEDNGSVHGPATSIKMPMAGRDEWFVLPGVEGFG